MKQEWTKQLQHLQGRQQPATDTTDSAEDGEPRSEDAERKHAGRRTRQRLDVLRLVWQTGETEDLEYMFLSRVQFRPSVDGVGQQVLLHFADWLVTVSGRNLKSLRDGLAARQCGQLVEQADPMQADRESPIVIKLEIKERR